MGCGTYNLYTTWIPIGDVPKIEGVLLSLREFSQIGRIEKHLYGAMDVDRDVDGPYAGGWFGRNPFRSARAAWG